MSIVSELLEELWDTSLSYKGVRVNIFGVPKFKSYNYNSLKISIARLRKHGFIKKDLKGWYLTKEGRKYAKKKFDSLKQFKSPFGKSTPKDLLLIFDVPEVEKGEREWLRLHLKKFGYIMIQKSVWVGPSPLPKEFLEYLKTIGMKTMIKTFKLAKPYIER